MMSRKVTSNDEPKASLPIANLTRSTSPSSFTTLNTSYKLSSPLTSNNILNKNQQSANNSFSNFSIMSQSMLYVNVKELNLKLYNEIVVSWNIVDEETSVSDFIGIYRLVANDSNESLDSQQLNGSKIGHITWSLNKLKQSNQVNGISRLKNSTSLPLNNPDMIMNTSPCVTGLNKQMSQSVSNNGFDFVEFRYYSGMTPEKILAKSEELKLIYNTESTTQITALPRNIMDIKMNQLPKEYFKFMIHDLKAVQLRKGMFFNPDPYVKISLITSCQNLVFNPPTIISTESPTNSVNCQNIVHKTFATINTCFPIWKNASFELIAHQNDKLLIEVKDKFAKTKPTINRFLGKVEVDMNAIFDKIQLTKGKHHFSYNLSKRQSSDNVTGSFSFSISLITGDVSQAKTKKNISSKGLISPSVIESPTRNNSSHLSECLSPFSPQSPVTPSQPNNSTTYDRCPQPKTNDDNNKTHQPKDNSGLLQSTSNSSITDNSESNNIAKVHTNSLPSCFNKYNNSENCSQKAFQKLVIQDNDRNSEASSNLSSSASAASASSTSSEEAANEIDNLNNPQITSSLSSSSSQSSSSNQIRSLSVSSSTSSSRQDVSTASSNSNSTERINNPNNNNADSIRNSEPVEALTNLLTETTLNEVLPSMPMVIRLSKRQINSRSKSLDKIKFSKQSAASPNTSFHRKNIYLKNKKNYYGLSKSNPSIGTNSKNLNQPPRAAIYLKQFETLALTTRNQNSIFVNKFRSKSESNLTNLIQNRKKKNGQLSENEDTSDLMSNSEIRDLIRTDLNSIVATLNESRQNNVAYEQIRLQVQKRFNLTVLKKIQQRRHIKHKQNTATRLKSNRSQSFPIMIEAFNSISPSDLKISSNPTSSAVAAANSTVNSDTLTNAFVISNTNACSRIFSDNVEENLVTNENSTPPVTTATTTTPIDDTDNLEDGIILIVESSLNSIVNTAANDLAVENITGVEGEDASVHTEPELNMNSHEAEAEVADKNANMTPNNNARLLMSTSLNYINGSGMTTEASTSATAAGGQQGSISSKKSELPQYWEARTDNLGRVFYIDHINRTTTWKRPKMNASQTSQERMLNSEIEKQRLDKRYQSIRRTINQSNGAAKQTTNLKQAQPNEYPSGNSKLICSISTLPTTSRTPPQDESDSPRSSGIQQQSTLTSEAATLEPTTSAASNSAASTEMTTEMLLRQPGALFILRPDLQHLIKQTAEANTFIKENNNNLFSILHKIRTNPAVYYKKYQHNKELVKFLNMFSDDKQPLPTGWEMKYEKNNKVFFVDHSSRSTTYIDPRLPTAQKPLHITTITRITPKPSTSTTTTTTTTPEAVDSNEEPLARTTSNAASKRMIPVPPPPPSFPPPPPPTLPPNLPPLPSSNPLNPAPSTSAATATPLANVSYADRVVAFLQQPNILEILKKNNILLSNKQRDKLGIIRQGGRAVYDRMCADLDLASIVSQLEDLIMCFVVTTSNPNAGSSAATPATTTVTTAAVSAVSKVTKNVRRGYERGFHVKLRNFYRKLEAKGYGQGPIKSKIVIRREKLLEDAKVKFMQLSKNDLRKNKINICFHGEEGLDYGGPAREFFFLLSRELFNPYYGLFEYSASDMYTVQISPMSAFQEHAIEWFQFAGRVLGIALIHQYLLDAFFTRPFYKALLRDTNWTLSDLETLDPEYCQSLIWIKENDITDVLDLTFSVTEDKCGQLIERDLKENGRSIAVTEKNKNEYLNRLIKWRVERGVQQQTEALVKGFYEVIEQKQVQTFDARELELVLCGTIEIDLSDWKKYTDYRSGYHQLHQVIMWFWQAVEKFDNEQKLKLLQFVTGTSSIPYEGFSALRGSNGPRKFCIERWGTVDALPRAHTCFNRLDLPAYPSFDILYEKILLAIEETSGFSIQ